MRILVAAALAAAWLALVGEARMAQAQPRAIRGGFGGPVPPGVAPAASSDVKPPDKDEPIVEVPRGPVVELGPKHLRMHLLDGSVISGDLSISEVEVETSFGKLVVPIDKIRSLRPGLDSNPKMLAHIEGLIKGLSDDDYKTREQAHKDLAAMGVKIRNELQRFAADENAEIKRHVGEILKELEEQSEQQADDDPSAVEQAWIRLDTLVTTEFTVTGKVSPQAFQISSKYGPLTIQLGDIKEGERQTAVRESLRRNITIDGSNIAQRSFKSSGIRVQAGDKISIKADGSVVMSPWGSNAAASPDGAPNYGWYVPNQIPGGALVARIGDKGTVFKVGRQSTFVAKNSGVLQLAIGMQAEYANEGYQYPGQYQVKLRVDPK